MRLAALLAIVVVALLPGTAGASGSRLSELGPSLVPDSPGELARLRAEKFSFKTDSREARIESQVRDRVTLIRAEHGPGTRRLPFDPGEDMSSPGLPVDGAARLLVRIAGHGAADHLAELAALGVEPVAVAAGYDFLEAWVPFDRIDSVVDLPWVKLVGAPGTPMPETGSLTSEGDAIHRADQARASFSIDGTGATVGIISDGVSNRAASQATLDLPAVINVGVAGSGDEGTAMLEIVHDLAPGAGLAFHTAGGGAAGMITAQNWLVATAGATVVCDDIWLPREPYFQDGPVAQNAANLVTTNGIVYFTSAGNRATRHIPQAYLDGGDRTIGSLGTFRPHDWNGGGDVTADIRLRNPGGTGTRHLIVLQWSEPFGAAAQDFDLYLVNGAQTSILQSSTSVQNGAGDPVEILDFTYNGADNVPARIVVDYAGPLPVPTGITLKIAANGPNFLEYGNPAGSINPHARHPLVFALGAIDQADPGNDTPESFSSRGPADMLVPAPENRDKPDAMAIDGVTVTGVGGFPSPFFGTSAAAPHAAALAALLRGADPTLTSADVRQALRDNAIDLGAAGFDFDTGIGLLDALGAVAAVLNEPPVADAGNDTTVECTSSHGRFVRLDGTRSYDPDDDPITYAWSAPGIVFDDPASPTPKAKFPIGSTAVTLEVSDGQETASDEVVVTVVDTEAPDAILLLWPPVLWPPNHKLVHVWALLAACDECDPDVSVRLVSITSDEPDNGTGDGDKPNDIQEADFGTDDRHFKLRAERSGHGNGRVYTVCYEIEDGAGNVRQKCGHVFVPHDRNFCATFTPADGEGASTNDGGYLEFEPDAGLTVEALKNTPPELGSDEFLRMDLATSSGPRPEATVVTGNESVLQGWGKDDVLTKRVRWFVPPGVIEEVMAGAEEPILYARVVIDGVGYVAGIPIEGLPEGILAGSGNPTAGGEAQSGTAPAPGIDASDRTSGAPATLSFRAAQPVRSGSVVEFGLPAPARALVALHTATGRRVATLADGEHASGWHRATLPRSLAPGLYFLVVETPRDRRSMKLVIVP